jgi:hypothetical protein
MAARAVPLLRLAGNPAGWSRPARGTSAHALYSDGSWRTCRILGWLHHHERWFVHIRWPEGQSDWREYDRRYLHPA